MRATLTLALLLASAPLAPAADAALRARVALALALASPPASPLTPLGCRCASGAPCRCIECDCPGGHPDDRRRLGLNMFPGEPGYDSANGAASDAKLIRQGCYAFTGPKIIPDLSDCVFGQFGTTVLLSKRRPALVFHVPAVVGGSPKEEMVGADAARRVACVANKKTWRDRPEGYFPREPVGHDSVLNGWVKMPVCRSLTDGPNPATLSLQDFRPEPLDRRR